MRRSLLYRLPRLQPLKQPLGVAIAMLLGLLHGLSFAWPGSGHALWWLQLATLTALVSLVAQLQTHCNPVRAAALLGFAFAWSWIASATHWLYISMHTYGGLPAAWAVAGVLALSAFLALFYGLALATLVRCSPSVAAEKSLWGFAPAFAMRFAAAWALADWMRGTWFTGFPWAATGYAHIDGPLAGFAPWIGVYGVGTVAALVAGLLGRRPGMLALATSVTVLGLGWGLRQAETAVPGPALQATLLQGAIAQEQKFQPQSGIPQALDWYGQRIRASTTGLVVAPETAIPVLPQDLPPGYLERLDQSLQSSGRAALVGIPLGGAQQGYSNAVIGLGGASGAQPVSTYRYSKHHLVPFGEFIPPLFRWFTDWMHIPLGDFARGNQVQPSFEWQGQRLAPNICYEDLFGEELGARFLHPAQAPTVMVNVSNMGWFGDGMAISQHLHISRMRALEFARPMLRATNTGATAFIDHRGQVLQALPRNQPGVLVGEVHGLGLTAVQGWAITPYAWWVSRFGLWPLVLLALAVLLWGHPWRSKRKKPRER